jgi:hypothetical protein
MNKPFTIAAAVAISIASTLVFAQGKGDEKKATPATPAEPAKGMTGETRKDTAKKDDDKGKKEQTRAGEPKGEAKGQTKY